MGLSRTKLQQVGKWVRSLQVKKYRKQEGCFVVEGTKSVVELLQSDFEVVTILGTERFMSGLDAAGREERLTVSEAELASMGTFQTNDGAIAVARMKHNAPLSVDSDEFGLVLDDIRDPGNLGTIVRTADWYGIRKIIASEQSADFYSPKVIAATMGSFGRVQIFYTPLGDFLKGKEPVFGAFLDGKDIHNVTIKNGGLIVIGNEAHGISADVATHVTNRITIPRYGHAESLNAAIATAVILDNIRRIST